MRAIKANPKDAVALFRYAQFLEKCDKKDLAEEYYLRSLEADPFNFACLQEYGNFLAEAGDPEEAEKFYLLCREEPKDSSEQGKS